MINAKTELQYQIALGILAQMKAAGFVTDDEAEVSDRLGYPGADESGGLCDGR